MSVVVVAAAVTVVVSAAAAVFGLYVLAFHLSAAPFDYVKTFL